MVQRKLFLAAYDVSDPKRLRQAHRVLRDYATGGQKSVFECFLNEREREALLQEMASVIDIQEDRFFLLNLDRRTRVLSLGIGEPPVDRPVFIVT